jgi:EpsI family protein
VCATALGAASAIAAAQASAEKPVRQEFASFPLTIGAWKGENAAIDAETRNALKATDYLSADYARSLSEAGEVSLFVSYYQSLSKSGAIHSPRVCLPGSGWEFSSFEQRGFGELKPGAPGTFNRVVVQKGEHRILMYYWIQQNGRRTASEFRAKYYLLKDSLTAGRKDGALVRLHTPITMAGEPGIADAEARLDAFARLAIPELSGYLP